MFTRTRGIRHARIFRHTQCRLEPDLLDEFYALGLQHDTRASRSLEGVRSTLYAGGPNAANSRRIAADSGLVRSFLSKEGSAAQA